MARPPIIVLGFPRSGTTLLRRLLDAHPAIACPGETFLLRSAAKFLRGETVADELPYGVVGGLMSLGFEPEMLHDKLRQLVAGFLEAHCRQAGKQRWAEKTAVDVFYIDEIEALYAGHAQFVCLLRHGLDVVASCHDLTAANERLLQELHPYVQIEPSLDIAYARAWVEASQRLIRFIEEHPSDAIVLRYEDLLGDPESVLHALFDGLGETWDPDVVAAGPGQIGHVGIGDWKSYEKTGFDSSSIGRWRELSMSVQRRLAPIVNPTLEACGYDPVPIDSTPTSPEDALRTMNAFFSTLPQNSDTSPSHDGV